MSQDRSLMERIHAGDAAALDEALHRYWRPLVSYASRYLSDRDAAEDIVQEAMLRLWEHRRKWSPSDRLRGMLYRMVRNLAINELKKREVRRAWAESPAHHHSPPQATLTPLDLTVRSELRRTIERAIDELPARRREVFILSRYHGHSYREIAELMGISSQTVANQMSAALDYLRQRLRPQVDTLQAAGD